MLAGFLLSLREGLEAALVVGIVLGALHKIGRPDLKPAVWRGVGTAIGLSLVAALALNLLGTEFAGRGEQIFEGSAMLLAAALLTWMIFWMHHQSRGLRQSLESGVHQAASVPGEGALFALALMAVLREGLELALFLFAARLTSTPFQTLLSALAGLAAAIVLGWALFASTRQLNLKVFFQATNLLLVFFAAGLVSHSVHEFIEAG